MKGLSVGILRFDPKSDPKDAAITWVEVSSLTPDPAIDLGLVGIDVAKRNGIGAIALGIIAPLLADKPVLARGVDLLQLRDPPIFDHELDYDVGELLDPELPGHLRE